MEIKMILNGTSEKEVKKALVCNFGNSIGFKKSSGNMLIVTSTQQSVIDSLKIVTGLTIIGEGM